MGIATYPHVISAERQPRCHELGLPDGVRCDEAGDCIHEGDARVQTNLRPKLGGLLAPHGEVVDQHVYTVLSEQCEDGIPRQGRHVRQDERTRVVAVPHHVGGDAVEDGRRVDEARVDVVRCGADGPAAVRRRENGLADALADLACIDIKASDEAQVARAVAADGFVCQARERRPLAALMEDCFGSALNERC